MDKSIHRHWQKLWSRKEILTNLFYLECNLNSAVSVKNKWNLWMHIKVTTQVIHLTEVKYHCKKNPDKICMCLKANANKATTSFCTVLCNRLPITASLSSNTVWRLLTERPQFHRQVPLRALQTFICSLVQVLDSKLQEKPWHLLTWTLPNFNSH